MGCFGHGNLDGDRNGRRSASLLLLGCQLIAILSAGTEKDADPLSLRERSTM